MKKILVLIFGCFLAVSYAAVFASDRLPIIGGESIGLARLGMTESEIRQANESSPCPVEAIFSGGKAVELRTSWGGGCATPEGMMASTYSSSALHRLYGDPDEVKTDSGALEIETEWWMYYRLGLSFKVMRMSDGNIVHMIAVFPKLDRN